MIRDPSDGSVRAPRKPQESGLPPVQDPGSVKEAERLQRARDWLKNYFNGQRRNKPPPHDTLHHYTARHITTPHNT